MQEYVIELSKYFIAFFMVLYTASCFYTFRYPTGEHHKGIFILQDVLMFLVQVLCFLNLSLTGGDFQYLFFFAFILIFLFATITMVSLIYENINRLLLNNMCMLLGIGLCMVSRLSFDKAIRQYVIVLVSLIFSLLIPYLLGKIHFFKKITWLYATLGIALLGTVLILGEVTHGSKISFFPGRNYVPALGICENIVPVFPGGSFMGECILPESGPDCHHCRGTCGDPGGIQGSGKCVDLLRGICVRGICGNTQLSVSVCGNRRRRCCFVSCLPAV